MMVMMMMMMVAMMVMMLMTGLVHVDIDEKQPPLKKLNPQVFGIFCTMFGEWLYRVMDDRVANCCLASILLLGTAMTAMIPSDYR